MVSNQRDKLQTVFAELDISEDWGAVSDQLIDDEINYILRIFELQQDLRVIGRSRKEPTSKDKKSLAKVLRLATDFDKAVRSMSNEAIVALSVMLKPAPLNALSIIALSRLKRPLPKSKGGRPAKPDSLTAAAIADAAARAYALLTGKPATPGADRITEERSQFEHFLTGIYKALDIEASSEVHAKARRRREKTRPA